MFDGLLQKSYSPAITVISPAMAKAYAAATDDTGLHVCGTYPVVPPMAVSAVSIPFGAARVVLDDALAAKMDPILAILHMEESITWHAPLVPGSSLAVLPRLAGIEARQSGKLVDVETEITSLGGLAALVACTHSRFLLRERKSTGLNRDQAPRLRALGEPTWRTEWLVAADQSVRYARVSGDYNPIHLDDEAARRTGLKGRVLHGLCTMAFAHRCVAEQLGDPADIRTLRVRFVRPVYMGDRLTCSGRRDRTGITFDIVNQEGALVVGDGWAKVTG